MSNRIAFVTPVGRLVGGSIYVPQTKDNQGNLLVVKKGPNIGKPRVIYFFAVAIPKKTETHWSQTEWGAIIYQEAISGFPNGQYQLPTFAWKVIDGDSTVPNKKLIRPCDQEGYAKHWIINFSSGISSRIYSLDGRSELIEQDIIKRGDYIRVSGDVMANGILDQPGLYINHRMIAFAGYGKRISFDGDPTKIFSGDVVLPPEVSSTPITSAVTPVLAQDIIPPQIVTPHPQILNVPAPIPPTLPTMPPLPVLQKRMTEKAQGRSLEDFLKLGWTEEQLIKEGWLELYA